MAKLDTFFYNGERDVLRIHLEILAPHVDTFIICEAKTTFSGYKKPLYFFRDQRYFKKFWNKIEYYVVEENYDDGERELARSSPNVRGATHWIREFLQKEKIKKAIEKVHPSDGDLCYIGDCDEVWDPEYAPYRLEKLKLRVYAYYLDNRSSEDFNGTLVGKWGDIKDKCLNHLRSDTSLYGTTYAGWHFTSQGGLKEVQRKLNDSYTTESYNTAEVQSLLPERHRRGIDYLGRPFTFSCETSEWPQYLKDNHSQYKHLCTPASQIQS